MPTMMYTNKVVRNVCLSVSVCSWAREMKTKRLEQTKNIECLHLKWYELKLMCSTFNTVDRVLPLWFCLFLPCMLAFLTNTYTGLISHFLIRWISQFSEYFEYKISLPKTLIKDGATRSTVWLFQKQNLNKEKPMQICIWHKHRINSTALARDLQFQNIKKAVECLKIVCAQSLVLKKREQNKLEEYSTYEHLLYFCLLFAKL